MTDEFRVGFCVSGGGRLFRAAAIQAETLGIKANLVVLQNKADDDLEKFCAERSIECIRMRPLNKDAFNREITALLAGAPLELLCLTFDRILPPELVRTFPGKILNVHPALLPAFTGTEAVQRALNGGTRYAGATIHVVDDGMDTGAIIAQCIVGTRPDDTVLSLGARTYNQLRLMYLQVIAWYAAGRVYEDPDGRVWVRDAVYGEAPISPAIELSFPD